jgi:hypothetical protein
MLPVLRDKKKLQIIFQAMFTQGLYTKTQKIIPYLNRNSIYPNQAIKASLNLSFNYFQK